MLSCTLPFLYSRLLDPASAAQVACTSILDQLGPNIVQFNGEQYKLTTENNWNLFNSKSNFAPTCIVFPTETSHVQTAMQNIFMSDSNYAVQAGTHSAMIGFNTVQDGVLISFSQMANVSYSADRDSITIQPGIHWNKALEDLEPFGVAPAGGRIGDVGAGLLLGGGFSHLAPQVGFSSDTYMELDVVLVNGDLVTATASNNYSDLFQSLKAGGNRFGIVTRYEVEAIHTGTKDDLDWFGGLIMYDNSSVVDLVKAAAHYTGNISDPNASILIVLSHTFSNGTLVPQHLITPFYKGTELPEEIFGEFLSIPSTFSALQPLSYVSVANFLGDGADRGSGQLFGASALEGSEDLFLNAYTRWVNFTEVVGGELNNSVLAFTPIPQSQIEISRSKGGVIDPPDGNYAAVQVQRVFPNGVLTVSDIVEEASQALFEKIPRSAGKPLYMNECDAKQNVFETYGKSALIKSTYMKYDPTRFNVRHMNGPIGL